MNSDNQQAPRTSGKAATDVTLRNASERRVDYADFIARILIAFGGFVTIVTVIVMISFISYEVVPLFQNPVAERVGRWKMTQGLSLPGGVPVGMDEYREVSFLLSSDGSVVFSSLSTGERLGVVTPEELRGKRISSAMTKGKKIVVYGTDDGEAGVIAVKFRPVYSSAGRTIEYGVEYLGGWRMGDAAITRLDGVRDEDGLLVIAAVFADGSLRLVTYDPEMEEETVNGIDIGGGAVSAMTLKSSGSELVVGMADGKIRAYAVSDGEAVQYDAVDTGNAAVTSLAFLTGDEALVAGCADGNVYEYFSVRHVFVKNVGDTPVRLDGVGVVLPHEERLLKDRDYQSPDMDKNLSVRAGGLRYLKIRSFEPHGSAVTAIAPSPRNKGFITVAGKGAAAYRYSTSGETYLRFSAGGGIASLVFAPKSNGLLMVTQAGEILNYTLEERHPEVTLKTLFSPVWYEGYMGPDTVWQSTGGTDDFESKFSLWPLIFGTFKGTLYAMLFSVPLAVLGAVYLSQMAPTGMRNIVKPMIELMAALPSVVVGFLAGLWLSPLMDKHLATFLLLFLSVPAGWIAVVAVFWFVPERYRSKLKEGREMLMLSLLLIVAMAVAMHSGAAVQKTFFGGDLKAWLYANLGVLYDPRNSIVVGFALGFAVIPIIFTISEDALSSVSPSLVTAAYALSASRWQTALYVVLPAASPGIFAGVMLGLGRAVGETMIVLMASGNTPVLDLSVFNGFRAMSAAIAVEIPEAPVGGSLYRVLFLTGLLLFVFTFVVNTASSFVSQRLRKKYSRY